MHRMTRREMLKLTALGLGSLAFRLPGSWQTIDLTSPKRLPVFPDAPRLGRVTQPGIPLRRYPNNSDDQNLITRLPAIPWCTYIQGGVAIHGAFWHSAFGERRSHGCVNVSVEDAKWIFRWTTPYVSLDAGEERRSLPEYGTVVYSSGS